MRIAIIGGGIMGSGIAEVCMRSNHNVVLVEANQQLADLAKQRIETSLERSYKAGKLERSAGEQALTNVDFSSELGSLEGSDIAIEVIVENADTKRELFKQLDRLLPDAKFLASNTSSVPIMKLGAVTENPKRVVGMHFFNPVPVMKLVEVVRSIETSNETLTAVHDFAATLGKQTIDSQDRAGFIVNALLIPYILSAIRMYESGFATKADIDSGMVLGCAHPMGPLALADLVGLDTLLAVSKCLYEEFKDPAQAAPPLLNRMVEAGMYGRKSGRGFYDYDD